MRQAQQLVLRALRGGGTVLAVRDYHSAVPHLLGSKLKSPTVCTKKIGRHACQLRLLSSAAGCIAVLGGAMPPLIPGQHQADIEEEHINKNSPVEHQVLTSAAHAFAVAAEVVEQ